MNKVFSYIRIFRKYFFLRLAVGFLLALLLFSYLYSFIVFGFDYFMLYYKLSVLALLSVICVFLAPMEALLRYIIEKVFFNRERKYLPTHKNKYLMVLDNLYSLLFPAVILFDLVMVFLAIVAD